MTDNEITQLQTKIAYQEDSIQELGMVVMAMQKQIDHTQKQFDRFPIDRTDQLGIPRASQSIELTNWGFRGLPNRLNPLV